MKQFMKYRFPLIFNIVLIPILLIALFSVPIICFNYYFIKLPQEKGEKITALIAEGNNFEAADLLYDFSYREYSDKSLLHQLCDGVGELFLYTVEKGDKINFGKYEQNGNMASAEDIEWYVVEKNGRNLVLETVKAIDYMPLNDESQPWDRKSKWEDSTLYQWLNTDFYESAFSETEKNVILKKEKNTVTLVESDARFDLENEDGSIIDEQRAQATRYAIRKGLPVEEDGLSPVWTRSKARYSNPFEGIDKSTYAAHELNNIEHASASMPYGIRPMITIRVAPVQ